MIHVNQLLISNSVHQCLYALVNRKHHLSYYEQENIIEVGTKNMAPASEEYDKNNKKDVTTKRGRAKKSNSEVPKLIVEGEWIHTKQRILIEVI